MKSAATTHFPRVIIEKDQKWLYNPVLRKRFKNRPEERVRLRWVEFLLLETSWKKNRIGFETPLKVRQQSGKLRADLLLYSNSMKPEILIECKSDSVPLNTSTAEQAARYNQNLDAPWLILTNGVTDYAFQIIDGKPVKSKNPVETGQEQFERDWSYWAERGFCSKTATDLIRRRVLPFLNRFWDEEQSGQIKYLPFEMSYLPIPMSHYYRIIPADEQKILAVSVMGHKQSGTFLTAVLNDKGDNRGLLIIDLEKTLAGRPEHARIITSHEEKFVDAQTILDEIFPENVEMDLKNIQEQIIRFFD